MPQSKTNNNMYVYEPDKKNSNSSLCKSRGEEAGKLMASNKILAENHKDAVMKLTTIEQRLQDRRDECSTLKMK